MAKKESPWQVPDSHNPDLILMSETRLKSDIHDSKVITPDLSYELFLNYRSDRYGGVMVAVKRHLIYELITRETICDFIAVKVSFTHRSLIEAALYSPPSICSTC